MNLQKFTDFEKSEYSRLKSQAKQSWLLFAEAIVKIRNSKLYKLEYDTFEEFCEIELGISKIHAYRLMESVNVIDTLKSNPGVTLLPNYEKHTRPLTKLEPPLQVETWAEVVEEHKDAPEKITAKVIAEKVEEKKELNEIYKEIKKEQPITPTVFVPVPLTDKEVLQKAKEIKEQERLARQQERLEELESLKQQGAQKTTPSNITLLEGDLFDVISQIPDNSVDLLNTDPPYMVLSNDWDTFKGKGDFLDFTEKWLKAVMPKVKSTGRVYISFAQWYQYDFYKVLEKNYFFGFTFKQNIIWYYKNNNQPSNRKEYRYMFEPIFYLYGKDAPTLNFTPDTYGETQQNVWEIAMPQSNFKEGKFHSAQKPLELYQRIIKTGSFDGDTVLDCFAGSGTTGIVCKELDRKCILIERDVENINIIKGRL